jgi:hypothetical protein
MEAEIAKQKTRRGTYREQHPNTNHHVPLTARSIAVDQYNGIGLSGFTKDVCKTNLDSLL